MAWRRAARENYERAHAALHGVVVPSLLSLGWWWPNARVIDVESQSDELRALLDMTGGVDLVVREGDRLLSYAMRVRFMPRGGAHRYDFTVRSECVSGAETELAKRRAAVAADAMRPNRAMQAWVYEPDPYLIWAAECAGDDLITYAINHRGSLPERTADKEGNKFVCVHVDKLTAAGIPVRTYWAVAERHLHERPPHVVVLQEAYGPAGRAAYDPYQMNPPPRWS